MIQENQTLGQHVLRKEVLLVMLRVSQHQGHNGIESLHGSFSPPDMDSFCAGCVSIEHMVIWRYRLYTTFTMWVYVLYYEQNCMEARQKKFSVIK